MSRLVFSKHFRQIILTNNNYEYMGSWNGHNDVSKKAVGDWPVGTYRWSHYNAHLESGLAPACHRAAYGCHGIHVFQIGGRPGLGVHSGRTFGEDSAIGGMTLGCIRVENAAMQVINDTHKKDPLNEIVVMNEWKLPKRPG